MKAESVSVTTVVALSREKAFALFTNDVNVWWKRAPHYRFDGRRDGTLRFEPGVGGRLVELHEGGDVLEIGRVLVWEPGRRLVLAWLADTPLRVGAPPAAPTEVDVRFENDEGGTRITLEHRGFERLPLQHPARYSLRGKAFLDVIRARWGDQLLAYAFRAKAS